MPVVITPGRLIICPHGAPLITSWHLDCRYQLRSITVDDLWDRMSAVVPVERGLRHECCTFCRAADHAEGAL